MVSRALRESGKPRQRKEASAAGSAHSDKLLRIGEIAERVGTSERALRYYEEIGLLTPAGHSPGGSRRYSEAEVARVLRIRELQSLMGFNLDEIRLVMANEDRLESLRAAFRASDQPSSRRRMVIEGLSLVDDLREKVIDKQAQLSRFLAELDERAEKHRRILQECFKEPGETSGCPNKDEGSDSEGSVRPGRNSLARSNLS